MLSGCRIRPAVPWHQPARLHQRSPAGLHGERARCSPKSTAGIELGAPRAGAAGLAAERPPRTCPAVGERGCPGGASPPPRVTAQQSRSPGRGEAPRRGRFRVKVKTLFFLLNARGRGRGAGLLSPPAAPVLRAERGGREKRASLELERTGGKKRKKGGKQERIKIKKKGGGGA